MSQQEEATLTRWRRRFVARAMPGYCLRCMAAVRLVLPWGWCNDDGSTHRCAP